MIVLSIETSGPVGSIALRESGQCLDERILHELGRRHAQSLVPEVGDLLRRNGIAPTAVEGVAVSTGPGSFTGLRVGVTFAKSFAYATGAALAGVDTFLAIAMNTPAEEEVAVIADAQRGGLLFGRYRPADGGYIRVGEVGLAREEDLPSLLSDRTLLTGPGVERMAPRSLAVRRVAPVEHRRPRATTVAALGEEQIRRGETVSAAALEPSYVRKSGAEEKRDSSRAATRSAGTEHPGSS